MKEQLISFETAKLAKEKQFNWCSYNQKGYNKNDGILEMTGYSLYVNNEDFEETGFYSAPTQSLLQKWLRDIHKLYVNVKYYRDEYKHYHQVYINGGSMIESENNTSHSPTCFNSYEDALETGLQEALKLI